MKLGFEIYASFSGVDHLRQKAAKSAGENSKVGFPRAL